MRLLLVALLALTAAPVLAQPLQEGPRRQSGPRFGVTHLSPGVVDRINAALADDPSDPPRIESPYTTQFGWQFEFQTFQTQSLTGVLEVVPLVGGLERGLFFPSVTFIAGARTRGGFEVGVGPNLAVTGSGNIDDPERPSGSVFGLAVATGHSFDAGGVNVPVNLAAVLSEGGARISLLVGLNTTSGRY